MCKLFKYIYVSIGHLPEFLSQLMLSRQNGFFRFIQYYVWLINIVNKNNFENELEVLRRES